ncbi:MAG: hypothetical protein ACOX8K_08840 [Lachnospiraceae bacterium]|jgi:hypothetical protein
MKKIKWQNFIIASAAAYILAGCSQHTPIETTVSAETTAEITTEETKEAEMETNETESSADETETTAGNETSLTDIKSLVGMNDEDTAGLLGGGEENWSNNFYIGRIYKVNLDGTEYSLFTTCGQDGTVESVSLWIVNGERDVTEEETRYWETQMTGLMGVEPSYDGTSSEGGSKNWKWMSDGMIAGMNQMKDILTLCFQPAVGELK